MEGLTLNLPGSVGLTDEQFYQFCVANETWKIELSSNGELTIMPPTGGESGIRNSELNFQVSLWNRQTQLGYVFDSSTVFRLPNSAKRSPDVAWVSRERWNCLSSEQKRRFPPLCPDFVIELRSETDRLDQLRSKLLEYLENGIHLGWLIDPQSRLVEIYRPNQAVERLEDLLAENRPQLSGESVLPGLVIDLTPILRNY